MLGFSSQTMRPGNLFATQDKRQQLPRSQSPSLLSASKPRGQPQPQQYDWEKEIESLDQKEMELHQTQMKLMREQMTNLMSNVTGLQEEALQARLQREAEALEVQAMHEELHRDKQEMQTELMALIEALQSDTRTHSDKLGEVANLVGDGMLEDRMYENHLALEKSLGQLHQQHGDTTSKHQRELAAIRDAHDSHKKGMEVHASMPQRIEYLERALGDSADKHTGKLETTMNKLDQLVGRIGAVEAQGQSMGKMFSALAGDKDTKHASLQERVDYVEGLLGDSADKHAKELEALKAAHDKHASAASKHAKYLDDHKDSMAGHHSTLQERIDDIENVLGLHADKHGDGLAEAAGKMDQLHARLAAVEKFGGLLDELRRSHGSLAKEKDGLLGKHATLQERLEAMDKAYGETFDKHGKHMQALGANHDKHQTAASKQAKDLEALRAERQAGHDALLGRVDELHQAHGDLHGAHAATNSQLSGKCQAMLDRLSGVEKQRDQIGNLQRSHDGLAAKKAELETSHASMGDRVGYLEQMLGDSVEKHAKELKELKDSHSKHRNEMDGLKGLHGKHASVDERLDYVEQCLGDSADKHAEELDALKRSHDNLHGKLSAFDGHANVLSDLKKGHGGLAAQKAQLEAHHAGLKERVDYLESMLGDSADKHTKNLDAAHAKLTDVHGRMAALERMGPSLAELKKGHADLHDRKNALDMEHSSVKERLDNMEALFGDASNRQTKELKGLKGLHDKHAAQLSRHASQLEGFQSQQEHHASVPERLAYLEESLGDSADKHAQQVAELHKKVAQEQAARDKHHSSVRDLLAREQEERGMHHASLGERVDYLEGVVGTNAEKHARELEKMSSGHQKLTGELKARGDIHNSVTERVAKLEQVVVDSAERQGREARATRAKFDSFTSRLSVVKEAWGQETPRT